MNLKISLINQLLRCSYAKKLRNLFGIRPSLDLIDYTSKNISVSDAFFWRTDGEFETIFKFTNILDYFYDVNESKIKLIFFDNNNNLLKEHNILKSDSSSKILINKSFLNHISNYGVFYVFHETNDSLSAIIRNSCYTGYSWKKNIPSMVHGNTITAQKKFTNHKIDYGIGGYSFFKKRSYIVQNFFSSKKTEVLLVNPTNTTIEVNVNKNIFKLKKGCSKLIDIVDNTNLIKINSKCYLLRPIVFENNNDYLNVYHG
jgi:hypothetical protein